jgi:hypothetical protein
MDLNELNIPADNGQEDITGAEKGTPWREVIINSAMLLIDDVRLNEEAAMNPALFLRRMSLYMKAAIPLLNHPPELVEMLTNGLHSPAFDEYQWVSNLESMESETAIETGMTGFEMMSCAIERTDAAGDVYFEKYAEAVYDAESGTVTMPVQETEGVSYIFDFYTDGWFREVLTATQKRLLGLAIASVWDERFSRNWLSFSMKVHDQTFNTVNESNYIEKVSTRQVQNKRLLYDELRKYAQDCYYLTRVQHGNRNAPVRNFRLL